MLVTNIALITTCEYSVEYRLYRTSSVALASHLRPKLLLIPSRPILTEPSSI